MKIKRLQHEAFQTYKDNEFLGAWTVEEFLSNPDVMAHTVNIAEASQIMTEIAELIEDVRKNTVDHYGEECADIVIRVMNFCSRNGIDLEYELEEKIKANKLRAKRHGKEF